MSSWPIRRVQRLALCAGAEAGFMVAGIEHDQAALLHEGVDLGEGRVRQRARVVAHRPIEDREEGQLVLVDIDSHGLGRLERGAGAQDFAQSRQAFLAGAIDLGVAGDDISQTRAKSGLQGEIVGRARGVRSRHFIRGRRFARRRLLRLDRLSRGQKRGGKEEDDARGKGPATEAQAAAQHQHGENVGDE